MSTLLILFWSLNFAERFLVERSYICLTLVLRPEGRRSEFRKDDIGDNYNNRNNNHINGIVFLGTRERYTVLDMIVEMYVVV